MRKNTPFFVFIISVFFLTILVFAGAATSAETQNFKRTFSEKDLGYTIGYPDDWSFKKQAAHIIIFSGKKTGGIYPPTVAIQNISAAKVSKDKKTVDGVISEIEDRLKAKDVKDLKIYRAELFRYSKNGVDLKGKQFVIECAYKGEPYRQWVIVIPHPSGNVYYAWAYTSPVKTYESNLATARAMLNSWVIK